MGNVLKRNGILPVPERSNDTTWATFIKRHQHIIAACDFFTTEVITPNGLITYYVLFFIHLSSRKVHIAGITPYPNEEWMKQMARNVTMADYGFLSNCNYLIHDRDSKFCASFASIIESGGVKPLSLPPRSPNLKCTAPNISLIQSKQTKEIELCLISVLGTLLSPELLKNLGALQNQETGTCFMSSVDLLQIFLIDFSLYRFS